MLARFPRGQLQPVVFSLSCSIRGLRSLANILVVLIRIISKNIEKGNFYIISIEIACLYLSETLCLRHLHSRKTKCFSYLSMINYKLFRESFD
ncbi:hypothetical protein BUZ00_00670 [Staphylococcus gallinarum]|nr:hypothetical protein BUZ00_00670 [Staphylococcus gallinarum]RIL22281.1 hypothetical protein BUY99_07120 [Staphylococcus gallinarum]RIL23484.1 hypothetical protein BUY97_09260 [Staphylococcus gallinarum]RIL30987.1 hypothetical protein BUY95_00685 [Staphylococcus gallinarum]